MALTPEQKAKDLIEKFSDPIFREMEWHLVAAKDSAIICVEQILAECKFLGTANYRIPFWQSVLSYLKNK